MDNIEQPGNLRKHQQSVVKSLTFELPPSTSTTDVVITNWLLTVGVLVTSIGLTVKE